MVSFCMNDFTFDDHDDNFFYLFLISFFFNFFLYIDAFGNY